MELTRRSLSIPTPHQQVAGKAVIIDQSNRIELCNRTLGGIAHLWKRTPVGAVCLLRCVKSLGARCRFARRLFVTAYDKGKADNPPSPNSTYGAQGPCFKTCLFP